MEMERARQMEMERTRHLDIEKARLEERRISERNVESTLRDYELELAQKQLHELKLAAQIEQEESRRDRTAREEYELREAKRELDQIRAARQREEEERRMREKWYVTPRPPPAYPHGV